MRWRWSFNGAFTATVDAVRARCSKVKLWIHVDDGSGACPGWAVPYEASAASHPERVEAAWGVAAMTRY